MPTRRMEGEGQAQSPNTFKQSTRLEDEAERQMDAAGERGGPKGREIKGAGQAPDAEPWVLFS